MRRFGGRRALPWVTVVAVVTFGAWVSSASAATLQVANDTPAPEQDIPVQLTFSGTADPGGSSAILAVVRPAGGLACAATYEIDKSAAGNASTDLYGEYGQSEPSGPFSATTTFKPREPGSYLVCAWLEYSANSGGGHTSTAPMSTTFDARGPQVSQLAVTLPAGAPLPHVAFHINYSTQTDQQLRLLSAIKHAGGLPCASSFELDSQQNQPETELFGEYGDEVFGGPVTSTASDTEGAGSYLICTWIEGPDTGEVDASTVTPVTIAAPPAPPPGQLKLAITRVAASRRHGVSVSGMAASAFTGRLAVNVFCGASHRRARPRVSGGRFKARVGLPPGCRHKRRVQVAVSWPGSSRFATASATTSARIRR